MDAEALAQALLGAATQRGAAHAEVWCRVRRGVRASSGSMSARATGTAAVLSVWMPDGRRGVASGTADPALAEAAVSGAAASAVQRRAHLPVLLPGLGLVDARNVSDAMVLETLEEIDADVAGAGGKTLRAHIDRVDDETVWASRALGSVRETARAWHLELEVAPAGRGTSGRYLTSTRTRSWATMASLPYGQTAAKRAVQAASARESVAQACPVVLLPGASATLLRWLAGQVVQASTGAQPAWLRRDEEVVHGKIHLRDDGLSVGGLRTCAFDAFGDPPRARQLFAESRWCEGYAAPGASTDERPTGHVGADARLRPRGLSMPAGLRSVHALHAELGGPLLRIDDLAPLGPSAAPRVVPLTGTLWHGTRPMGAFRDQPFLVDPVAMARGILAVSSETDRHDDVDAPALVVSGVAPVARR
jgi:hypothetical protein